MQVEIPPSPSYVKVYRTLGPGPGRGHGCTPVRVPAGVYECTGECTGVYSGVYLRVYTGVCTDP